MTSASSSMTIVFERSMYVSSTSRFRLLDEHALVLEVDVRATNCGSIKYRLKDKHNWNQG